MCDRLQGGVGRPGSAAQGSVRGAQVGRQVRSGSRFVSADGVELPQPSDEREA